MTETARIARLLDRTGFGPVDGDLERWPTYDEAVAAVLSGAVDDGAEMPAASNDDSTAAVVWWLQRMIDGRTPLVDKMVLFWHSTITSSSDKASAAMMVRQHNLFRRHALGNFRDLLHAVIPDAAMLVYLDADGSDAHHPNENLGRELMELFTLGPGAYTERDVRAASRGLAGLWVDWDSGAVNVDDEAANDRSITLLGTTGRLNPADVIDIVCDHDACAPFVAGKLYRFLAGTEPDDARRAELAATFRDHDLEIRPLVEAIIGRPDFAAAGGGRARFPVEWLAAHHRVVGVDATGDDVWRLDGLGQRPLSPPNVAGWPVGPQWQSSGRQLLKASVAMGTTWPEEAVALTGSTASERVADALRRCGVYEPSPATVAGLELAASRFGSSDGGDEPLIRIALCCPEASCC